MLPGFRFLFAAIMLSMSLLIFGLGAAALFRAAHESFASNSAWRATPEVPFAQRPDTTLPMLATLRVEAKAMERAYDEAPAAPDQPAPSADQPAPSAELARNDQVAALRPVETSPAEIAKPVELPTPTPVTENPPAVEAASLAPASETTTATEPQMTTASIADAPSVGSESAANETVPVRAELAAAASVDQAVVATPEATAPSATAPADSAAATKIATLGGPPVDVSDEASVLPARSVKLPRARPDQAAIEKRVQARRELQRRRLAALHARVVLQQQFNPFGQPQAFPPPATRR